MTLANLIACQRESAVLQVGKYTQKRCFECGGRIKVFRDGVFCERCGLQATRRRP